MHPAISRPDNAFQILAYTVLLGGLACAPNPAVCPRNSPAAAPSTKIISPAPTTPPPTAPMQNARKFRCTLLLGLTVTNEWYSAGFEDASSDARWEARLRPHTFVGDWADPDHEAWKSPIASPCADRPDSPDRVVVVVADWKLADAAAWNAPLLRLVSTAKAKFPELRRLELLTMLRAPQNRTCGDPKSVVEPFIDQALLDVAAMTKGLVQVGPKLEVPSCDLFEKGGPHLNDQGRPIVAKIFARAYAD